MTSVLLIDSSSFSMFTGVPERRGSSRRTWKCGDDVKEVNGL